MAWPVLRQPQNDPPLPPQLLSKGLVGRAAPAACAGVRDVAFHGGMGGPLQMACEAGHAALVRMLLDKGFNPCLYRGYGVPFLAEDMVVAGDSAIVEVPLPCWWSYCPPTPSLLRMAIPRPPIPPRVTLHRVAGSLRGPGRSPARPFACCVGSLRSVGRCGRWMQKKKIGAVGAVSPAPLSLKTCWGGVDTRTGWRTAPLGTPPPPPPSRRSPPPPPPQLPPSPPSFGR